MIIHHRSASASRFATPELSWQAPWEWQNCFRSDRPMGGGPLVESIAFFGEVTGIHHDKLRINKAFCWLLAMSVNKLAK